jgi:cell division protein FtsL
VCLYKIVYNVLQISNIKKITYLLLVVVLKVLNIERYQERMRVLDVVGNIMEVNLVINLF